jgi:lysophospholipid acyltransferase (LPLAT)-like uncharacterized protein
MKPIKYRTRTQRIVYYLFGWLTRIVFFLLFSTCRVTVIGREVEEAFIRENPDKGLLYASWHRGLMYFIYFYRFQRFVVMASASKDGELAAQTVKRHGWIPIRGSSSYRGSEALREMIPYFKKGHRGGLVVDAPQGPPQVSKIGIIIMARLAGLPIVPVMWSADRCWRLKSWDRTIIPKPFSRIVFFYPDKLLTVPRKASKEECEHYRQLLDDRLNRMMYQTDRFFKTPGIKSPAEIAVPGAALEEIPATENPNTAN